MRTIDAAAVGSSPAVVSMPSTSMIEPKPVIVTVTADSYDRRSMTVIVVVSTRMMPSPGDEMPALPFWMASVAGHWAAPLPTGGVYFTPVPMAVTAAAPTTR